MTHEQARRLRWLAFFCGAAVMIPFIRADDPPGDVPTAQRNGGRTADKPENEGNHVR